jgi:hypothetical protein
MRDVSEVVVEVLWAEKVCLYILFSFSHLSFHKCLQPSRWMAPLSIFIYLGAAASRGCAAAAATPSARVPCAQTCKSYGTEEKGSLAERCNEALL